MENLTCFALAVLTFLVVGPVSAYLIVRAGTLGYYRGLWLAYKLRQSEKVNEEKEHGAEP